MDGFRGEFWFDFMRIYESGVNLRVWRSGCIHRIALGRTGRFGAMEWSIIDPITAFPFSRMLLTS